MTTEGKNMSTCLIRDIEGVIAPAAAGPALTLAGKMLSTGAMHYARDELRLIPSAS
jgi:hypothetical protein